MCGKDVPNRSRLSAATAFTAHCCGCCVSYVVVETTHNCKYELICNEVQSSALWGKWRWLRADLGWHWVWHGSWLYRTPTLPYIGTRRRRLDAQTECTTSTCCRPSGSDSGLPPGIYVSRPSASWASALARQWLRPRTWRTDPQRPSGCSCEPWSVEDSTSDQLQRTIVSELVTASVRLHACALDRHNDR